MVLTSAGPNIAAICPSKVDIEPAASSAALYWKYSSPVHFSDKPAALLKIGIELNAVAPLFFSILERIW